MPGVTLGEMLIRVCAFVSPFWIFSVPASLIWGRRSWAGSMLGVWSFFAVLRFLMQMTATPPAFVLIAQPFDEILFVWTGAILFALTLLWPPGTRWVRSRLQ